MPPTFTVTIPRIVNSMVSDAAAIAWTKISKAGAQLSDIIGSSILGLANGGSGADLSATGGSGKFLKQTGAGAVVTVDVIAASELPSGIDAAKIADGSVSSTEYQYINSLRSNAQDQIDTKLWWPPARRTWWLNFFPGNQIPISVGLPAITSAGTISDGSTTNYQGTTWTGATSGTTIGPRVNSAIAVQRWGNDPHYRVRMKTGADITNIRICLGLYTSTTLNGDGGSVNLAIFRFSTVAGDSNWQAITNDGSVTGTVTDTGIAVATSTEYEFAIVPSADGTSVAFYVNGVLKATHTTKVPAAGTLLFPIWSLTPQAAVSKAITFFWTYGEYD